MSPREQIELSSRLPAAAGPDEEDDVPSRPESATGGRRLSSRRAYVLVACSISQLPIWGFAMTWGIFQDYLESHWTLKGNLSSIGVIGTTSNGCMYLAMPILFSLLSRRYSHLRRHVAVTGVIVASASFLLSSFSTTNIHLILTLGVLSSLGCTLVYSPTTLSLSENFSTGSRSLALGIVLSSKNITGSTCPFLLDYLLTHHGLRLTLRIWAALVLVLGLACTLTMPLHPGPTPNPTTYRPRRIPWSFLHHRDIWIFGVATLLQSSGYGLPQTYLSSYARSAAHLSATSSTLLLVLFNAPGVVSSAAFGLLADNKRVPLSASATAGFSAVCAALAAWLLWGLAEPTERGMAVLGLFAVVYGFMAGGYSATWGGVIKEMEGDAAGRNEALDTGVVYGLLNGARGVGYVAGGLAGVQLLKVGEGGGLGRLGYGTSYGPVIVYTGLATAFGGWSVAFGCWGKLKRVF